MFKHTALALVVGLATIATTLPSNAQFFAANIPNKRTTASSSYDCADEMGHVRRISVDEVKGIHDRRVWLYPVCERGSLLPRDDYGTLFLDGNAGVVRREIGRNPTLMNALRAKGYDEHDVISVVPAAGNSVLLYVHQRDMN